MFETWHDRGDATVLAEPAPRVLSHGDVGVLLRQARKRKILTQLAKYSSVSVRA